MSPPLYRIGLLKQVFFVFMRDEHQIAVITA